MKNIYIKFIIVFLSLNFSQNFYGQTLLHYWNFNVNTSEATIVTPTLSQISGSSLTAIQSASSVIDFAGGTGQNFEIQNLNARNSDVAGTHLRFNNPIGGELVFAIPTTGYQAIVVKFATRRSASGAGTQNWFYSTDGTNYVALNTIIPNNGDPALATLDFSGIVSANNNPNFKIKVSFSVGTGGTVGNNRFDNFTVEGTPAGGLDTTPPTVTINPANASVNVSTAANIFFTFNEPIRLVNNNLLDNTNVDANFELRLNNATGNLIPFDATISGNIVTIDPTPTLLTNQNYYVVLLPNTVEDFSNNAVSATNTSIFTTASSTVSIASNFITVNENQGVLNFVINISSPTTGSVNLVLRPSNFNTANAADFTFASQTINLTPSTSASQTISIPIIDDTVAEQQAEYFVLALENPVGYSITGNNTATIFIRDNDKPIPTTTQQIKLNFVGSFDPSGISTSTCEIVAYDPISKKLFATSAIAGFLDIINFSDPTTPTVASSVNMSVYGGITSVAVKNGIVAVSCPNANEQLNGSVVFLNTNGVFQKQVTVGALPDMLTFTPDGTKVLTANEGQPNVAYTIDPEGSVSIIDISGGIANLTQSNVTTLGFTSFNGQETTLTTSGVRKVKATSTLSQDLEPEYITINPDSTKAWVVLQENNAIAEINLSTSSITSLWGLGLKDVSLPGNGMDISDNNGQVLIANWPMKAFYEPDGISHFNVAGTDYIVTANEGDEKDYTGFSERIALGDVGYVLNPTNFSNASVLKQTYNMGRFRVTNANGNTDTNPDFEEIFCNGTRSFSIFNANTKQIVYDSGDSFETYSAANFPTIFNADHTASNTPKARSRVRGPEPEGITTAKIGTQTFAFITIERLGGVMVFNVTNPNAVTFVDYKNSRSTSAYSGDQGPEGIIYIPASSTITQKSYIVVANEISGTISTYEVDESQLSNTEFTNEMATFNIFPNPSLNGIVYFNRMADVEVFDATGKSILKQKNALTIDIQKLATGIYFVKTTEGIVKKLIVK